MAAEGTPVADMETRVVPAPAVQFHWSAFADLSSDRQVGFGIGPIPWTAIDRYAERHDISDPDEYDRFVRLMRGLDRAFIDWHSEHSG